MVGSSQVLARAECAAGEVVLRRRGEILELMVNGAFAMDTTDVSTEVLLATEGLQQHSRPKWVLVGGLGLGFTTRALLADPRVSDAAVLRKRDERWGEVPVAFVSRKDESLLNLPSRSCTGPAPGSSVS